MATSTAAWLVLVWRLPAGGSTDRVWIWRTLRRLGAGSLTPGAAALPYSEESQEQLDWLAEEVDRHGGDAWVLPVVGLSGEEAHRIREQIDRDRDAEYARLRADATAFLVRAGGHPGPDDAFNDRLRTDKELLAFQRRYHKIRARDHFSAAGRREAARAIDRCLEFRQGISRKLQPVTDARVEPREAR
jgi:hypothetical protein